MDVKAETCSRISTINIFAIFGLVFLLVALLDKPEMHKNIEFVFL